MTCGVFTQPKKKKEKKSDFDEGKAIVRQELQHYGQMQGYRWLQLQAVQVHLNLLDAPPKIWMECVSFFH